MYHITVLIYISVITNKTEYLFICCLDIWIFSFCEVPIQIYLPIFFLLSCLVFLLICRILLYILYTYPLITFISGVFSLPIHVIFSFFSFLMSRSS